MATPCAVQQKIHCIFKSMVIDEPSKKRDRQEYRVIASETIRPEAYDSDIKNGIPTEKLDGTCCLISEYMGRPWLWARHEKKMTKDCEKRYKRYLTERRMQQATGDRHDEIEFKFDMTRDFKDTPDEWVAARNVMIIDDVPQPDANGHIPGWVPTHPSIGQHRWHSATVDMEKGLALVLRSDGSNSEDGGLEIAAVPLTQLNDRTLELIGTNINANPYGLGSKSSPQHYLVEHGSLHCRAVPDDLTYQNIKQWFIHSQYAGVEGIVWHCDDGAMYKLHRNHVDLKWPVKPTHLTSQPVTINIQHSPDSFSTSSLFHKLAKLDQKRYEKLTDIELDSGNKVR